jgi:hypothetical protein
MSTCGDTPARATKYVTVIIDLTGIRTITACREADRTTGRRLMTELIASLSHGIPHALTELAALGRTLKKRAVDMLAYFDRPGTSNGPTEAINGRLEHLRGSALGFRNLTMTSPDHCSRPAASDPNYTLDSEEPVTLHRRRSPAGRGPSHRAPRSRCWRRRAKSDARVVGLPRHRLGEPQGLAAPVSRPRRPGHASRSVRLSQPSRRPIRAGHVVLVAGDTRPSAVVRSARRSCGGR